MLLKFTFLIGASILFMTTASNAIPMEGKDSNSSEEDEKTIESAEKTAIFEVKPISPADDVPSSVDVVKHIAEEGDASRAATFPTAPIIFSVQRSNDFLYAADTNVTFLSFDASPVISLGGGISPNSGIFTAPVAGYYQFSFSSYGSGANTEIAVVTGEVQLVAAKTFMDGCSLSAVTITQLQVGDEVGIQVFSGSLSSTNFSGVLLAIAG